MGCEGGVVTRGIGRVGGQGEDGREENAQSVFPHYKFNLTNGSENLETMEYMKCGRVYHAAVETRGGPDGNIVRADPYSPGSATRRTRVRGRGVPRVVPARDRRGEWQNTLLARQEIARGEIDARFLSRLDRMVCKCYVVPVASLLPICMIKR